MHVLRSPLGRGRPQRRVQGAGQPVVGPVAPPVLFVVLTGRVFSVVVFDLDGTLLDSDAALAAPYVALGVPASDVTYGHVVAEECRRLGLSVDDYVSRYDVGAASPFDGVAAMVARLGRWAVCSNKVRACGEAELRRLGWEPEVVCFAEDFGGGAKRLGPVLDALGRPEDVVFVGDTDHDRAAAEADGVPFALAAWNSRAAKLAQPDDLVLSSPADLLPMLRSELS